MQDSAETEETLTTLGATTKALPGGGRSEARRLRAAAGLDLGNAYYGAAGYVTANLNLWPRPLVLVANQASYDDLTDEQRDALATATSGHDRGPRCLPGRGRGRRG